MNKWKTGNTYGWRSPAPHSFVKQTYSLKELRYFQYKRWNLVRGIQIWILNV